MMEIDPITDPRQMPVAKRQRNLLRRYPMISLAMAATVGVQAGQWSFWITLAAAIIAMILYVTAKVTRIARLGWLAVLCVAVGAFCLQNYSVRERFRLASICDYTTTEWQPALMRIRVISRVEKSPNALAQLRRSGPEWQSVFDAELIELKVATEWLPVDGGVRVRVDGDATKVLPGAHLEAAGFLQQIPPPRNPGEPDLRRVYEARGQQARARVDSLTQLTSIREGWHWQRPFAWFGAASERLLESYLGESTSSLAAALVLGRREAVDREQRDRLLETGTAHLLSVSGLHLGVVAFAAAFIVFAFDISPRWQFLLVISICILYAALTGARPPVLRATLLVGVLLLSTLLGREIHPLNALAIAAVFLLLGNPANAAQVGVQLSFLAVATLMFASRNVSAMAMSGYSEDPLERLIDRRTSFLERQLRVLGRRTVLAFQFSFWVWAVTAPLVWHTFHVVSPISIVANVALSVPLTIALLSGLAAVLIGMLYGPLGFLPAKLCEASLSLMVWIIDCLAAVPLGHFWLPSPPGWWVLCFYAVVGVGLALPHRWPRLTILIAWMALWSAVAYGLSTTYRQRVLHPLAKDAIEAHFIDVGHGTSVLVREGQSTAWLYDCGRLGDPLESSRPIEAVLWDYGLYSLDAIVVSHADSDHYNALPGLLRRFSVKRIVTPPGVLQTDEPGLRAARVAIQATGVPVVERSADTPWPVDQGLADVRILHPPPTRLKGNDNVNSLVLQLNYGGRSLLLPGDIEMPGTESLMTYPRPLGGGILMAPHHGSLQEDMRPLLDWARPRTVVVSGGRRAGRPEVLQSLGQNGADVFVTALEGAVRTQMNPDGRVTVQTYHSTQPDNR